MIIDNIVFEKLDMYYYPYGGKRTIETWYYRPNDTDTWRMPIYFRVFFLEVEKYDLK